MKDTEYAESKEKSYFRFFQFLFFELSWKVHRKLGWWRYISNQKMSITRKIKIIKIWNLICLSIQPIPNLSCKFKHFWKKQSKIFEKKKMQHFLKYIFYGFSWCVRCCSILLKWNSIYLKKLPDLVFHLMYSRFFWLY